MSKKIIRYLVLSLITINTALPVLAQTQRNFFDYPLTQLVFNDGSSRCGYYDSTNNVLYDCTGNIISNKPADVHHKLPGNDCCRQPNDADGDAVTDKDDKCPDIPGPASNFGCPVVPAWAIKDYGYHKTTNIFFTTGSYKISTTSYVILKDAIQILKDNPDDKIHLEGHTDNLEAPHSSLRLSTRRAAAVATYLAAAGIDKNRISTEAFGSERPIAFNKIAAGRAKNRRVELKVRIE